MTPPKTSEASPARSSTATTQSATGQSTRKTWKKKSPVDVVLDQINKAKKDAAEKEEAFKEAKRQVEKLEAARKILEAT